MRFLIPPLVAAVLLVGCGDSKPSATFAVGSSSTASTPTVATTPAVASVPGPLFDMGTLDAAVVQAWNTTPPYTPSASMARCRLTGKTSARCAVITDKGAVAQELVTITPDGYNWQGRPAVQHVQTLPPIRHARRKAHR